MEAIEIAGIVVAGWTGLIALAVGFGAAAGRGDERRATALVQLADQSGPGPAPVTPQERARARARIRRGAPPRVAAER